MSKFIASSHLIKKHIKKYVTMKVSLESNLKPHKRDLLRVIFIIRDSSNVYSFFFFINLFTKQLYLSQYVYNSSSGII